MTIGIVGGMGSYATVDFFRRIIDAFPVEKEWDRPRIIIDNYCTMPSRVRAILYHEKEEELVTMLADSIKNLMSAGADKIVLACNTSHVFIPKIRERISGLGGVLIDIIDTCGRELSARNIHQVNLIATEGTIETGIYKKYFAKYDIEVLEPDRGQYECIRGLIESVKQNKITEFCLEDFARYISSSETETVVLGCTELPILYSQLIKQGIKIHKTVMDPLQCVIDIIVKMHLEKTDK